jgi:hypothetical protein
VGSRIGTTAKYLRRTTSGAAGNGLYITMEYLRRLARQRPGYHEQVPAMHNERRRGERPEPIPGITDY